MEIRLASEPAWPGFTHPPYEYYDVNLKLDRLNQLGINPGEAKTFNQTENFKGKQTTNFNQTRNFPLTKKLYTSNQTKIVVWLLLDRLIVLFGYFQMVNFFAW